MDEVYIVICDGMVQYVSASGAQPTAHVIYIEDDDEESANLLQVANQLPRIW